MWKNSKFVIILFFFLLVLGASLFVKQHIEKQNSIQKVTSVKSADDFTDEEFLQIKNSFLKIVEEQNPGVALAEMRERIKTDDALSRACHDLIHVIGHASYEKYRDFAKALEYRDELCNSGYIHGVIESYFSETKDVLSAMKTVCNKYKQGSFLGWECYHGVGHGVMFYTNNDLPKALELCASYGTSVAKSSCVNGVFMENFNTMGDEHHTDYLKNDDLFFPCSEQSIDLKPDCYLYAPVHYLTFHKNDYIGALSFCETAEKEYVGSCISGLGSQAMKENINNPLFVENICNTSNNVPACIHGMMSLYINHFGSIEPATSLCSKLSLDNQAPCIKTVSQMKPMFL